MAGAWGTHGDLVRDGRILGQCDRDVEEQSGAIATMCDHKAMKRGFKQAIDRMPQSPEKLHLTAVFKGIPPSSLADDRKALSGGTDRCLAATTRVKEDVARHGKALQEVMKRCGGKVQDWGPPPQPLQAADADNKAPSAWRPPLQPPQAADADYNNTSAGLATAEETQRKAVKVRQESPKTVALITKCRDLIQKELNCDGDMLTSILKATDPKAILQKFLKEQDGATPDDLLTCLGELGAQLRTQAECNEEASAVVQDAEAEDAESEDFEGEESEEEKRWPQLNDAQRAGAQKNADFINGGIEKTMKPVCEQGAKELVTRLREGGYVIYVTRASTGKDYDELHNTLPSRDCKEEHLTQQGKEIANDIGEGLQAAHIPIGDVVSSKHCSAVQTAELASQLEYGYVRGNASDTLNLLPPCSDETDCNHDYQEYSEKVMPLLTTPPDKGFNTLLVGHADPFLGAMKIYPQPAGVSYVIQPKRNGVRPEVVAKLLPKDWEKLANLE